MKTKLVGDLMFEVTRRCTMHCAHCLRGDAQNLDIQKETIDQVLDQYDGIQTLVFTGGEPALNVDAIRYIFNEIKRREISLGNFFIATNGTGDQLGLAMICMEMFQYADEKDLCEVTVSRDIYHDELRGESPVELLTFCSDSKDNGDYCDGESLIRMGRTESADFDGVAQLVHDVQVELGELFMVSSNDEQFLEYESILYVSCNGRILADCDVSYEKIDSDEYTICTASTLGEYAENLAKSMREPCA